MKYAALALALSSTAVFAQTVTFEDGSKYTLGEGEAVFVLKRLVGEAVTDEQPESCPEESKVYDFYDWDKDGQYMYGSVQYCYDPCIGPSSYTACGG